ncbi:hypothetical protein GCM10018966_055160 [Streptomyces yanii]
MRGRVHGAAGGAAYEIEPIFAVRYCSATDVEILTLAHAVDFTDVGAYRASARHPRPAFACTPIPDGASVQ